MCYSRKHYFVVNRFVRSVVCGQNSTMALTDGGEVFAWGFNGNGQLGAGNLSNQHSPALVIGLHNVVIEQVSLFLLITYSIRF